MQSRWYLYLFARVFLPGALLLPGLCVAQSSWDASAAPELNWSNVANWSDNASPAGKNLLFNSTGAAAAGVTSIVDSSTTAGTLLFQQNSKTVFHQLQINSGQVLTLAGAVAVTGLPSNAAFLVGGVAANLSNTEVSIGGETPGTGSFVVSNSAADFVVNQTTPGGTNTTGTAVLNLSGLGSFSATVNEFLVGATSSGSAGNSIGKLTLAGGTNTITSDLFAVGVNSITAVTGNLLRFGQTNTFNTGKMVIAGSRASTTLEYIGSGTATFKLRHKDGVSATTSLWIGDQRNNSSTASSSGGSSTASGVIDGSNVSLDWLVTDIYLGNGASVASSNDGSGTGTLNFALGTINVTTLHLGRVVSDNASAGTQDSTSSGTVNMSGGTLNVTGNLIIAENQDDTGTGVNLATAGTLNLSGGTVSVNGNIRMAQHTATPPSTRSATATLNLTGGTLTVGGNITTDTEATNVDTITLNGATLDLTNGTIGSAAAPIDTFNFQSGTLRNVMEFNGGGAITKSTAGTATLSGTNTFTGLLNISGGTLNLNGTASGNSGVFVGANARLAGTGTITPAGTGAVSVAAGGEIAPGDGGIGTLTINSGLSNAANVVSLASGAELTFEVNAGIASDRLGLVSAATGDLLFGGNVINFLDLSNGVLSSGAYTLFSSDAPNAFAGLISDGNGFITSGLSIGAGLENYSGASLQLLGNNVVLNIIPEPTSGSMASIALFCWLFQQRRYRPRESVRN